MVSNKGLNSKEALDESTATNSSVTLSGIRREKETTPADLDIEDYTPDPGDSDRQRRVQEHSAFDITIWKRFVFAIAIGLAVVGLVSANDNMRAVQEKLRDGEARIIFGELQVLMNSKVLRQNAVVSQQQPVIRGADALPDMQRTADHHVLLMMS